MFFVCVDLGIEQPCHGTLMSTGYNRDDLAHTGEDKETKRRHTHKGGRLKTSMGKPTMTVAAFHGEGKQLSRGKAQTNDRSAQAALIEALKINTSTLLRTKQHAFGSQLALI